VKGFTPAQIDGSEDKDITWTAGVHHLDGQQALDYVGQRYGLLRDQGESQGWAESLDKLAALVESGG